MSDQLKDALKVALATPGPSGMSGLPLLIWGPPGGAKTAFVQQIANELGLHLETVLLSVREPADVAGLPVIVKGNGVRLEPPCWAQTLYEKGEGVLFFDELSCAAPATQAAALRIVAERVVGELQLPPGIRIIAATNPAEQAAGGWDLAAPLANRFIHVEHHAPRVPDWISWLIEGGEIDEVKRSPSKLDQRTWRKNYAKAAGAVASFMTRKPGLLGPNVPKEPDLASRAWPSPRSWELATRSMAGAWAHDIDTLQFIEGSVGPGPAREFLVFLKELDLPDPARLLHGEEKFKHNPARLDRSIAVLTSVAAYTKEEPELCDNAWGIVGSVLEDAPDIAVPAAQMLSKSKLTKGPNAIKVLSTLQETMIRANIGGTSK